MTGFYCMQLLLPGAFNIPPFGKMSLLIRSPSVLKTWESSKSQFVFSSSYSVFFSKKNFKNVSRFNVP